MSKLWEKTGQKAHPAVNDYIISPNLEADNLLLVYDIQASIAHAKMLHKVGLITKNEANDLVKILAEIKDLHQAGGFKLEAQNEDMHTAIENYLTQKLGDTGKKIHTGRSRNDQILVAIRLFSKAQLAEIQELIPIVAKTILDFAQTHEFVPMSGYTHTQRAMPSSVGQWASSFTESLLDDLQIVNTAFNLNNQNPLGSAAGFGTSLPIDREFTTKELDFAKTQINPIYCQNSRGKIESFTITALLQVMETLGKIATDLLWFTSKEFDFFTVDVSLTTGSSIMPQKRNLDIMEVLRANVSVVQSYQIHVQTVSHNLISGYHKDLKTTKKPLIEAFKITKSSLQIVELLFKNLQVNHSKLAKACSPEVFATDAVNELVKQGVSFRDAYKQVANNLESLDQIDLIANIKSKTHLGSTGNLGLDELQAVLCHFSYTRSNIITSKESN